jgi:hypothetical protein
MTDNRTTELLHKLLDERGVEYFTDDDERAYDEPARTTWDFVLCGLEMTVTATEFVDVEGKTYLEMDFHHAFTPEQAIAATLGSELNPDGLPVGLTVSEDGELLNWRGENYVRQSTLGSGTLTAEQVRECAETVYLEGYNDGSVNRGAHIDETDTIKPEKRPAILNGRKCFVYTSMQSMHCGFVVEFEDGTLGEAVQGVNEFRFLDSKEMFEAYCWEGDA